MNGIETGDGVAYGVFVGQFVLLGWTLGPAPIQLVHRGLVAMGWNVHRPSIDRSRRVAAVGAAVVATVEMLRRLHSEEPLTLHAVPLAAGFAALLAGSFLPERRTVDRGSRRELRAQLAGAGVVVTVAALLVRPTFGLIPAGVVLGMLIGLALISGADGHLIRRRLRPLISWLSISQPTAKEPELAARRLLVLMGALPGFAIGTVLALRQVGATSGPSWSGVALVGAGTAVLAAAAFLLRTRAAGRRLMTALRGKDALDRVVISDARALLLSTAPAALLDSASMLFTTAPPPRMEVLAQSPLAPWVSALACLLIGVMTHLAARAQVASAIEPTG